MSPLSIGFVSVLWDNFFIYTKPGLIVNVPTCFLGSDMQIVPVLYFLQVAGDKLAADRLQYGKEHAGCQ